ncbi:hypothetical protein NPIL_207281 [Nephila pilipes]|uniref:Uncharacterized protein n=1 Tax=Nephila pilipes TaxID=299642 RepID=A0A8X6PSQ1_NEPPI|nr:hypothetical protein NPIL_207281 [Nephila pilipes]
MDILKRYETVKAHKICYNYFYLNHTVNFCYSKHSCFVCGKRPHTLLHRAKNYLEPKRNHNWDAHPTETQNLKSEESGTEGYRAENLTVYQTLSNMSKQPNQAVVLNCF